VKNFVDAKEMLGNLSEKLQDGDSNSAAQDTLALDTEFKTLTQMVKMTVGRRGNNFPILTKEYFSGNTNDVGTRENVLSLFIWLESIDPEVFFRQYKNQVNRIVPYVILIPSYGDTGACWEAFDRLNRATSRGRIFIPMYPKNLKIAVLSAVADLRWTVAKEKASVYWMEEGLTGYYYQWFSAQKIKGNIKDYFVQDYINWILKESEGTQAVDKQVRGVFWRYMPFAQDIKEKLKLRSLAYQELYQKDQNRAQSDGF
jgi:hypothetical protein